MQTLLAFAFAGACGAGCSFLFHAEANQCAKDSDCAARGFAGTTCEVSTGTCILRGPSEGGTEGGAVSCKRSSDCPAKTSGMLGQLDVACDVNTHTCVQLNSEECPYVIGDYKDTPDPIFIGAFATFPNDAPMNHPSFLNYSLALNEFGSQGGIPVGSGLRTPVAVVCSDTADPDVVMRHLVNDVHVAVVVAPLNTATLLTTFSNVNGSSSSSSSVLFVNPFGSDSLFASIKTRGLLWSLLGQPSDVAPAYEAFFPWVEKYVRKTDGLDATDGGAAPPLRVATVTSNSPDTLQLAAAAKPLLHWNGGPATATNKNYKDVILNVSTLNADAGPTAINDEVVTAAQTLADFKPNVVISFGSEEFISLVSVLDGFDWKPSMGPKPFYLVGPYNSESVSLKTWIGNDDTKLDRVAGINFASAPANYAVLTDYENRFVTDYPNLSLTDASNYSNYYDAMYFAVYSLVAAASTGPVTGIAAGGGMVDLTFGSPPGHVFDVGPADIGNVESFLANAQGTPQISLNGTLGPPDFNQKTGVRTSQGDVYCLGRYSADAGVDEAGTSEALQVHYVYDVLRLEDGGRDPTEGGEPALEGTFSCYDGMAPP